MSARVLPALALVLLALLAQASPAAASPAGAGIGPALEPGEAGIDNPGPQQPVQTLGRRMLESYPFVPVVGSIRIVVAIFSYDGGLYFGVTGDYDGAPDVDVLTAGIERGMAELLAIAEPPAPAARAKAKAKAKPRAKAKAKAPAKPKAKAKSAKSIA